MQVHVVAYPPYRSGLGPAPLCVELNEGATLRDLLRELARRSGEFDEWSRARSDEWLWGQLLVHSRGEMVRLRDQLHDGDRLELLPPIAGGS